MSLESWSHSEGCKVQQQTKRGWKKNLGKCDSAPKWDLVAKNTEGADAFLASIFTDKLDLQDP